MSIYVQQLRRLKSYTPHPQPMQEEDRFYSLSCLECCFSYRVESSQFCCTQHTQHQFRILYHSREHTVTMRSTLPAKGLAAWLAVLFYSAAIISVQAADPDPLVDVSPEANGEFILRDVFKNGDVSDTEGGVRAALNIDIFPALMSQGITYVQFKMTPCGSNTPHTHPRASELLTLISGGPLQAGLVDTSGTPHIYILYPGDIVVFPRGLLHFELNVGNETAFYISALNSQNPGVLTAGPALLKIPDRAAATALNQDLKTISKLKKEIYAYSDELQLVRRSGCVPGQDITPDF